MIDTERGLVSGFMVKLVLFLAIVGFGLYETGAVVITRIQVDSIADHAANAGADSLTRGDSNFKVEQAARAMAKDEGAFVVSITIARDRTHVTVTVEKIAPTVLIQHIGPLKKYRLARSTHDAQAH